MRLAELVGTFSLATDAGTGVPEEHGLRAAAVAVRLAQLAGADDKTQKDAFYLALLRYVGCSAGVDIAARVMSDEIEFAHEASDVDFGRMSEVLPVILARALRGRGLAGLASLASVLSALPKMPEVGRSHCETAVLTARRLGFAEDFLAAIHQGFERWDGSGQPHKLRGGAIALPMRLAHVALDAVRGYQLGDAKSAAAFVGKHAGRELDPELSRIFTDNVAEFSPVFAASSSWKQALEVEPTPHAVLDERAIDEGLLALADFTDMKSLYTRGHSRCVAELASKAAKQIGLGVVVERCLYRAGLVHDVGRVAVSPVVWDKAGPLSDSEWERVRLHAYVGERILSRAPALRDVAEIAALTHERLDGSGYHRGVGSAGCAASARLLAAADTYQALLERRAYRPAYARVAAASELRRDGTAGKLCSDAVEAVLAAAGHHVERKPQATGLTPRELEVLTFVAKGFTNKEVASALAISVKTVGRHLEHIFDKLAVTTRAGATMVAMQRGLLTS